MVDTTRMTGSHTLQERAEVILADIRGCPPARGFDRVEVPGERERRIRDQSSGVIHIPERTWNNILALSDELTRS